MKNGTPTKIELKTERYRPADDDAELLERINAAVKAANETQDELVSRNKKIGVLLIEAKKRHPKVADFEAFLRRVDGAPKLSWAYDLMKLAEGRTTDEELKKEARDRQRKSRAGKKKLPRPVPERFRDVTESAEASARIHEDVPQDLAEAKVVTEPTVEEAEAEVKRLKALKAKINANCEDGSKIDSLASAKELAGFKLDCERLARMNADDVQHAIDHFAEVVAVPATELMPDLREMQLDLKIAKAEVTALRRQIAGKLPPNESRAAAWSRLASEAASNIQELIDYQGEFQEARDAQPDSLQDGPFAEKCDEVCNIDLESALETVTEAGNADLPLGFGRD